MAYEDLTPARFKELKPQFADVPDATVQQYIDLAGRLVDKSWTAGDYEAAWVAMTCHLMTLDGLGTDSDSKAQASGSADYQTIKSGQLTLTRFRTQSSEEETFSGWLNKTKCGRFYSILLKLNRSGPRVASVSGFTHPSGYAKDWCGPAYGWPGVFF